MVRMLGSSSTTRMFRRISNCLSKGQAEEEAAAMPGLALYTNHATVRLDDFARNVKAQACHAHTRGRPALRKLLEDARLRIFGNAGPGVDHLEEDAGALVARAHGDGAARRR